MAELLEAQPLADIRVVDLTHGISGPYCTKLLADFGADVIKIERPDTGDFSRTLGPFAEDTPHLEKSGLFLYLNTNKRSIVLDLKTSQGVEAVKELVKNADVLVENFRPGVMAELGLGYEVLSNLNPNLVMTSISNFGQTGPYRDYLASELTLFAMGGRMHATGLPDRYPLKLGGNHVQYQAGNVAAMATLFAWYADRYRGMGGQQVDISILETQLASVNSRMAGLVTYQYTGDRGRRLGDIRGGFPSGYYPCQDGYISLAGGGPFWPRTVAMLRQPELLEDPRFAPPLGQLSIDGREEFETTIWLPWLMERTKQQVVEELQAFEILSGVINTIDEVVDNNPQLDSREYFVDIEHPIAGKFRYPGAPLKGMENWWQILSPAPLLGQHTQQVLGKAMEHAWIKQSRTSTTDRAEKKPLDGHPETDLPLKGIRVIDMTVVWAGPYGTMFLGDMGAEVIRVESVNLFPSTTRGYFARPNKEVEQEARRPHTYPDRDPGQRPWNRHAIFNLHSRNKYSMTADLNTPEGKDVFRRLVEVSDLFIENNVVGSMARLGLTYDVVSKWNQGLIMISSTGLGQTGPWSGYRGMGLQFEAPYGHASVIGYPDMDVEGVPGSVAADATTGVTIAMAAIIALHQRHKTGKGTYIDISMGETFLPHLGDLVMDYTMNGRVAERLGNRDPNLIQGAYQCDGDDEWIAISLNDIQSWRALCLLMKKPELLQEEDFTNMDSLHSHHERVDEIIQTWTMDQDCVDLFHILQTAGIACGPLLNEPLAYNNPHLKERNFFISITQADSGTHLYPSTTFKMSQVPFTVRKPPVLLGEDNDYIYLKVLGLSEEEYDNLKALGQIGMEYAPHIP